MNGSQGVDSCEVTILTNSIDSTRFVKHHLMLSVDFGIEATRQAHGRKQEKYLNHRYRGPKVYNRERLT